MVGVMSTTDPQQRPANDLLMTTGQLAELLGVSRHRVRRCVDRIEPDAPRAGRYRLVLRSAIPRLVLELHRTEYRVEPQEAALLERAKAAPKEVASHAC